MNLPGPGLIMISETTRTGTEDCVTITTTGPDGQNPHVRLTMTHEAFGKLIMGNGFQPCEFTLWRDRKD